MNKDLKESYAQPAGGPMVAVEGRRDRADFDVILVTLLFLMTSSSGLGILTHKLTVIDVL